MAAIRTDAEHARITGYICPVCENEELELGQNYCQICGEPLEWKEDCD